MQGLARREHSSSTVDSMVYLSNDTENQCKRGIIIRNKSWAPIENKRKSLVQEVNFQETKREREYDFIWSCGSAVY